MNLLLIDIEISSFWVRVSIRFQKGDKSDRCWNCIFRLFHLSIWCSLISIAILLTFNDQAIYVSLYNITGGVYILMAWIMTLFAYNTIYKNTISRMKSTLSSGSKSSMSSKSGGSGSGDSVSRRTIKKHNKNVKNIQKLTRVAFAAIIALTIMCAALVITTGATWTKTIPLGYFVNVGIIYRFAEILYLGMILYTMNVQPSKLKKEQFDSSKINKNKSKLTIRKSKDSGEQWIGQLEMAMISAEMDMIRAQIEMKVNPMDRLQAVVLSNLPAIGMKQTKSQKN